MDVHLALVKLGLGTSGGSREAVAFGYKLILHPRGKERSEK